MKTEHPFIQSIKDMRQVFSELTMLIKLKENVPPEYIIFNNEEILKMFSISSKTAQNWRDEGILMHFKIKGKIFYRLSDIKSMIDDYTKKKDN